MIGKTPVKLFDVEKEKAVILTAGNYIKFESINEKEYKAIIKDIDNDGYNIKTTVYTGGVDNV